MVLLRIAFVNVVRAKLRMCSSIPIPDTTNGTAIYAYIGVVEVGVNGAAVLWQSGSSCVCGS